MFLKHVDKSLTGTLKCRSKNKDILLITFIHLDICAAGYRELVYLLKKLSLIKRTSGECQSG